MSIGYCHVMSSLHQHLAEEERREAYLEAITQRAEEIDEADALDEMTDIERDRFALNIRAMLYGTPESERCARAELIKMFSEIKKRMAKQQIDEEDAAAREDAAVSAWEARQDRYEAWA